MKKTNKYYCKKEYTMTDKINAKEYNLWDLMSGDFIFNIPDYQRPYSWTENEAVALWDDLVEFWQDRGCGRFLGPELSNSKTASILHRTQTP